MNETVSIIVPFFNTREWLFMRCLESLLSQTHDELDIVIVDDGSDPGCAAWLETACRADSRVRLLRQSNAGVASARNAGVEQSFGSFVCFVDSDDFIESHFVATALRYAQETFADVVFGGILCRHANSQAHWRGIVPENVRVPVVLSNGHLWAPRSRALADSPNPHEPTSMFSVTNVVAALYSARLVRKIKFENNVTQGEDRLYNFRLLGMADRVAFVDDAWYIYDHTLEDSATKQVNRGGVGKLKPLLSALAQEGRSLLENGAHPALARSADVALFNYVKVAVAVAGAQRPGTGSGEDLRDILSLEAVRQALSRVEPDTAKDRLVLLFIKKQWIGLLLLFAIIASVGARLRSCVGTPRGRGRAPD